MVGGFKRQRHTAFVAYGKRFQRGYGMLLHVRPNLESCHVIDRHVKVVLAVYVLPAELNHVLAVAGNQTLCGRGYGMLLDGVKVTRVVPAL